MERLFASLFTKKPSLLFCISMDLIGMASYVVPALGEWSDTIWAPLSAYIFYKSFGSIGGLLGGTFSFLEELLPFTDVIPTFTIAWYLQQKMVGSQPKRKNTPDIEDAEVIEIK